MEIAIVSAAKGVETRDKNLQVSADDQSESQS